MPRSTREAARSLRATAQTQGGYFTAKQAKISGYDYPHLEYHLSTGAFERVEHGLYRLADMPVAENDDLIRLSWWSRNRADEPQAVVSHESALSLHDLSELLPDAVHLTVPPGFRKEPPEGSVLHRAALLPDEVEERVGFRVTTPLRTLLDVAAGTTSQEQLEKAVEEALARGLVRKKSLVEAVRNGAGPCRLERALGVRR
jgi:predicted transcriptional regulator of viral defense system